MEYVKIHPALERTEDFEDEDKRWSHLIRDADGNRILFGDYYYSGADFDFDWFRLQFGGEIGYLPHHFTKFTWAQARELGETIVALADKHEGKE